MNITIHILPNISSKGILTRKLGQLIKYKYFPCKIISGPNLDLLRVQQSDAAPFREIYANLYFDAKHLEKGLNRGW